MTYEELAEEYAEGHSPSFKEFPKAPRGDLKQAFLAGLKAGRPKWHKIADGDLPPLGKDCVRASIKVLDDYRRVIAYDYGKECWRDCQGTPLDLQPEFWCEIPICMEE